ncbi:MAG: hypothetical protein ACLP7Q_23800 [Isosphaeraceae bacterium]
MASFAACLSVILLAASDGVSLARASGLVIEVPNVIAPPGTSGSFDVLLADTDPVGSPGIHVAADSIGFSIDGSSGVSFTNATINTTSAPYIYVDSGTQGGPLSLDAFPNTSFTASDSEFAIPPGYRLVNQGDEFGLMNVSYTVSASAPNGSYSLLVDTSGTTSLSDEKVNSIPFTVQEGLFTVGTAVPGPPSWILGGTGLLFCLAAWRFGPGRVV